MCLQVLYGTEPIDEPTFGTLGVYEGKQLVDVTREGLSLGDDDEDKDKVNQSQSVHNLAHSLAEHVCNLILFVSPFFAKTVDYRNWSCIHIYLFLREQPADYGRVIITQPDPILCQFLWRYNQNKSNLGCPFVSMLVSKRAVNMSSSLHAHDASLHKVYTNTLHHKYLLIQ